MSGQKPRNHAGSHGGTAGKRQNSSPIHTCNICKECLGLVHVTPYNIDFKESAEYVVVYNKEH